MKKMQEYWKLKILKFKEVGDKVIENSQEVKQRHKKVENIRKKIAREIYVRKFYI